MGADTVTAFDTMRADLLEMAAEDCYGFPEFWRWIGTKSGFSSDESRLEALRRALVSLIEEGVIRVHTGVQCSFPISAPASMELGTEKVSKTGPVEWDQHADPLLCLCSTSATESAYNREWQNSSESRFRKTT